MVSKLSRGIHGRGHLHVVDALAPVATARDGTRKVLDRALGTRPVSVKMEALQSARSVFATVKV
jgi:hypothetical protein